MGFKLGYFNIIGGSDEFPVGNTDELRRSRSEIILTKLAQALINCGVGWELDATKNATATSYTDIPTRSTSKTYPGLFFKNTTSGCKLFMAYFGDEMFSNGIKNFSGNDLVLYKSYDYHCGVCCSIIPEGSASVFGDPSTTTFLPSDATRICGTCYNNSSSSSRVYNAAYNPTSGYLYSYCILATPYCVSPYSTFSSNGTVPDYYPFSQIIYATGRIFGYVAHEEIFANAKYGTYIIREGTDIYESFALVISSTVTVFGETIRFPGRDMSLSPYGKYPSASISRADGTWILGSNSGGYNVIATCPNVDQLSSKVFDKSSGTKTRWIPIWILLCSSSLASDGVVSGDGVKGFLDTDLFRCGVSDTQYQVFGGSFVNLEGQNLLTGIDTE